MKWHGLIGFETQVEVSPGPGKATEWRPQIVPRHYYGEVKRFIRKYDSGDKINDDISINNQISVISDQYLNLNAGCMKWIEWLNKKWKIHDITVEDYNRLTIDLGGEYQDGNDT